MGEPKTSEVRERLAEVNEDLLTADGFDEALIGYVEQFGRPAIALYDREKCIQILMERDGMDREGAEEFFEFNTIGGWVGDSTPAYATIIRHIKERADGTT